jgi:hypothetical protein
MLPPSDTDHDLTRSKTHPRDSSVISRKAVIVDAWEVTGRLKTLLTLFSLRIYLIAS